MVWCQLPNAGLGNQLFPLMKAYVFAHLNKLPVVVTGYHQIKIGPYFRNERTKRRYSNSFTFQKNILSAFFDMIKMRNFKSQSLVHDPLTEIILDIPDNNLYHFSRIPHWDDYFKDLKSHRPLVIKLFWEILREPIKQQLAKLTSPVIGVHIRMGDFRKLRATEDFSKVGTVRTPEEYFIDVILSIRNIHGSKLPVSIFTDGFENEVRKILQIENVKLFESKGDIVDMLLLSKSKIIVTSAGSTFGYWAGFLSDAPIILHPAHIHQSLRANLGSDFYEGPADSNSQLLNLQIKSIVHASPKN